MNKGNIGYSMIIEKKPKLSKKDRKLLNEKNSIIKFQQKERIKREAEKFEIVQKSNGDFEKAYKTPKIQRRPDYFPN